MSEFNRRSDFYNSTADLNHVSMLALSGDLNPHDAERLQRIKDYWNFYDGYHWEDIPADDRPQITENHCRKFINRYVPFEMGSAFTLSVPIEQQSEDEGSATPITDYLTDIWEDNSKEQFCIDLGQMKAITGDAWVQVKFEDPKNLDDPFNIYPNGRIRLIVNPTGIVFPVYDPHDKDKLLSVSIQYPIEVLEVSPILRRQNFKKVVYKQYWDKDRIVVTEGGVEKLSIPNPYGLIPFVQIKNLTVVGREDGLSDLEDLIPLNMELNLKKSDVSEIIDYHSAPVTVVFGAKVGSLEKGANKIWGGLPKDAKVQNLELNGDLTASVNYIRDIKDQMHDIGGLPQTAEAISNTSGVALQIVNQPLIEKTKLKRLSCIKGLQSVNKLILYMGLKHKLINIPEGVSNKDFYKTEVSFSDNLPKDKLLELQQIQLEMQSGLEDRQGAMERLGKEDIKNYMARIDKDMEENPVLYGRKVDQPQLNSGMTNGSTQGEEVNKSLNGQNVK